MDIPQPANSPHNDWKIGGGPCLLTNCVAWIDRVKISRDVLALSVLMSHPWPGNIRELQSVIERSVIVCETDNFSVDESWLSRQRLATDSKSQCELSQKLAVQEKELIEAALDESGGRVFGPSGAAAKLGIHRSTLRIQSYFIEDRQVSLQDCQRLEKIINRSSPSCTPTVDNRVLKFRQKLERAAHPTHSQSIRVLVTNSYRSVALAWKSKPSKTVKPFYLFPMFANTL
ncbi:MAG TPA: helix-turn-helix domain-containing protein [Candidatus Acidoferrum sp.]|nr:helix-turn-helix domain-containing protein [Candidatus Acidoferrum sp.]